MSGRPDAATPTAAAPSGVGSRTAFGGGDHTGSDVGCAVAVGVVVLTAGAPDATVLAPLVAGAPMVPGVGNTNVVVSAGVAGAVAVAVPKRQRHQRRRADVTPCRCAMLSMLRPRTSSAIRASQKDRGRLIRAKMRHAWRSD